MRPYLVLAASSLLLAGCGGDKSAEAPKASKGSSPATDDADVLKALGDAKLKKNAAGNVVEVDFRGTTIAPEQLHLSGLPALRSVLLNGLEVTEAHLTAVAKSKTITNLDLRGCSLSNEALKPVAEMQQLRALRLNGGDGATTVDDAGLAHISGLTNLKALALDKLWVGKPGIEHLAKLSNLQELYLAETGFSDDCVELLANHPKLKKLRISKTEISDEGLQRLAGVKSIEDLDLSENAYLTDSGMAHVGKLTGLRKLNVWRLALTDEGIRHFSTLTNMEWLNLDNTQLTDEGLESLAGMKKLTFLHLGSTQVTDTGLHHLEALTSLKDLKLTRTGVTGEGASKLEKALPGTAIQLKYREGE